MLFQLQKYTRTILPFLAIACIEKSMSQSFHPGLSAKFQQTIDSLQTAQNVKGIAASVFIPQLGMWRGANGISNGTIPIRTDMEFGIASNTKLFTAVTILKLAELNLLKLDDSIKKWLPVHPNIDSTITIRQLLNHTSGVGEYNNIPGYSDSIMKNPNRIFKTSELIQWIGAPEFPKGTSWSYCNSNYLLAGMIAEAASGSTIAQLIRTYILNPLQMDSTFFDVSETVTGDIASPWQMGINIGSIPRKSLNSAAYSAGAMYSTVREMNVWYQSLMAEKVINAASIAEMKKFVGTGNYGLGISKEVLKNRTCYTHGGSIRGYQSFMLYDSAAQTVIAVFVNANPGPARLIAQELLSAWSNYPMENSSTKEYHAEDIRLVRIDENQYSIESSSFEIPSVRIYNTAGQVLFQDITNIISTSNFNRGIYFIELEVNQQTRRQKIFVE